MMFHKQLPRENVLLVNTFTNKSVSQSKIIKAVIVGESVKKLTFPERKQVSKNRVGFNFANLKLEINPSL